ncbi:MAG: HAD family hydrolase [Sphingobacteriales bacterium]|nr:MAG: HAD family hydrolase [Sphingobacteriales bacterium]
MVEDKIIATCYHCGEECGTEGLKAADKSFCCNGCMNVYQLLHQNELDDYYCLNQAPGQKVKSMPLEKFAFLDEETVIHKLLLFRNEQQAQVSFYLPQMYCSSCLWLLEHLSELDKNIIGSQVSFNTKTLKITFQIGQLSLRALAELLARIGYEPVIDIYEDKAEKDKYDSKRAYLKLGITGFCFANIMLIAFPEYLGLDPETQPGLALFFKIANVLLALPVVFYGAREFFVNAWYSYRQRYLNIDAPIALAVAVTFGRSLYEVWSNTGTGYFDSMSGIVFFMLLGRTLQNRSYTTLRFNRDYKSYFPVAVSRIKNGEKALIKLEEIKANDVLMLHHQEVIPTDCLLSKGKAKIDYSFVTGEDKAEYIEKGAVIYAGGRNAGAAIEVLTVKPFSQNSFTQLWNSSVFQKQTDDKESRITLISKYFSLAVLLIALGTFIAWQFIQPAIAWKAATAVLIVACPCSLLLTSSFTNGYLLERLASVGCYLKNAQVLEELTRIQHIAFDKTGTLTAAHASGLKVDKMNLDDEELGSVLYTLSQSLHPLSRAIVAHYHYQDGSYKTVSMKEVPGAGIEAWAGDKHYKIGNALFAIGSAEVNNNDTRVYVTVDGVLTAQYSFEVVLVPGAATLIQKLSPAYELSLLSGDNDASRQYLEGVFGKTSKLSYNMKPAEKLHYITHIQESGKRVMMVGDGLNDAGALQQSDVGVAVVKSAFAFSPACDVIMEAEKLRFLPQFIAWAKGGKRLITTGFIYSLLFNITGLGFAVTGNLSPLVAAILMPSSSLGIILIAYLGVRRMARLSA